jgi:hypothetical protein
MVSKISRLQMGRLKVGRVKVGRLESGKVEGSKVGKLKIGRVMGNETMNKCPMDGGETWAGGVVFAFGICILISAISAFPYD